MTINYESKLGLALPTNLDTAWGDAIRGNFTELAAIAEAFNILHYGAVGDGATNNKAAIETAAAAAAAAGGVLHIPPGTFAIASGVYIPSGCDVVMDGLLLYTGAGNESALTIGETNVSNMRRRIEVNLDRDAEVLWSGDTSIGVDIKNPTTCIIDIRLVQYFTTGVKIWGDSAGCSYNTIHIGHISGCQTALLLSNRDSGWCNENNFYGGRISNFTTGLNLGLDRTGIKITSDDASYVGNNNNTFYRPSIEIHSVSTTGAHIPIHVVHGIQNAWHDMRVESNTASTTSPLIVTDNASSGNFVDLGYSTWPGPIYHSDLGSFRDTIVRHRMFGIYTNTLSCWASGSLAERAYEYDGAAKVALRGMHVGSGAGTTIVRADTGLKLTGVGVESTSSKTIGVRVDARRTKRFIVRRDLPDATKYGRVAVRCYDAAGTILEDAFTGSVTQNTYVKGISGRQLFWDATAKWYRMGSDSGIDLFVEVHADVKYIDVQMTYGTAAMLVSGFSIEAVERDATVTAWSGIGGILTGGDHNNMLATAAPATAATGIYYEQGTIIHNVAATVGQPIGWMCSVAGAPGTWVALANL